MGGINKNRDNYHAAVAAVSGVAATVLLGGLILSDRGVCRISMRHWWATRLPRCSPRLALPIATRCGCSDRRRRCTGSAAGRCFFARDRCPRNLVLWVRRLVSVFFANSFIWKRRPDARRGALAGDVGLPHCLGNHVSPRLWLDPFRVRGRLGLTTTPQRVFGFPTFSFGIEFAPWVI